MAEYWASLLPKVWDKLDWGDIQMKKTYEWKQNLTAVGVEHIFAPGVQVLVKSHLVGKLKPKAHGPYTFVRYGRDGRFGTARVNTGQRVLTCSVA